MPMKKHSWARSGLWCAAICLVAGLSFHKPIIAIAACLLAVPFGLAWLSKMRKNFEVEVWQRNNKHALNGWLLTSFAIAALLTIAAGTLIAIYTFVQLERADKAKQSMEKNPRAVCLPADSTARPKPYSFDDFTRIPIKDEARTIYGVTITPTRVLDACIIKDGDSTRLEHAPGNECFIIYVDTRSIENQWFDISCKVEYAEEAYKTPEARKAVLSSKKTPPHSMLALMVSPSEYRPSVHWMQYLRMSSVSVRKIKNPTEHTYTSAP